ncbi:MAG: hypothetical protein Sapg2KO_36020 [Saprospiraceae bacterium]
MKNKTQFFCLLLLCFLFACGGRDKNATTTPTTSSPSPDLAAIQDSLYEYYMETRPNDYPKQPIIEKGKLYPVDEAPIITDFLIFRGQLLDIVREKDFVRLIPLIDQNIKADFGEDSGKAGFIKMWGLNDPAKINDSELWSTLERVLSEGGSFHSYDGKRSFTAPYTYSNWNDEYDGFEYVLVKGGGVRFRALPNLNSKIITNFSHDYVKLLDLNGPEQTIGGETYNWAQVESLDGEMGYVWGKFIQSHLDFRAGFEEQAPGKWRMIFFVAGD